MKRPKVHLAKIVQEARREAVAPAHLEGMKDLAAATMAKVPRFHDPEAFNEFVLLGPWQLYLTWARALWESAGIRVPAAWMLPKFPE